MSKKSILASRAPVMATEFSDVVLKPVSKYRRPNAAVALAVAASISSIFARVSNAQNGADNWQGNSSVNWSDSGNWNPATNSPPISGDSLIFGTAGSSGTTLTDDLMTPGSFSLTGITFNAGASAFTINPNAAGTNGFTLAGSLINSSSALQIINDSIALSGTQSIATSSGGGDLTLGGTLTGSGDLYSTGAGTLTVSAANSFTGNTNISNGTTVLSGSVYGAGSNSSTVFVGTGATLNVSSGTTNNALGFGPNATWSIAGTLTETNTGKVLSLPGNVTLSGGTLTSSGTNTSSYGAYFGGSGTNGYATTITANGTGNTISATSFDIAGVLSLVTPQSGDTLAVSTPFTIRNGVSGSILKSGLGTVTFSGASTYSGNTNVSAGTLVLAGSLYGAGANSATVIVASGATLNVSSGSNNVLGDGANATWAISGTLNETVSTAVLTTPGNIQLSGGTLSSSSTNSTGYGAYFGGAAGAGYPTTITGNGTGNIVNAVSFGIGGVETLVAPQATDTLTISTPFFTRGTAGAITTAGLGTVTLSGANTYTGNTNVSAGTLVLAGSLYGSAANTATVSVASGATLNVSSGSNNVLGDGTSATWLISGTLNETSTTAVLTMPGSIQLSGGTLTSSGTNTSSYGAYFGGLAGAGYATTITGNGTGNTISAVSIGISGVETLQTPLATDSMSASSVFFTRGATAGAITKTGQGTVILTGSNTYNGITTISAGTLQIGNGGTGGTLGTGSVTDNGILAFDVNSTFSVSNAISGSGGLLQMAGVLTLPTAETYTGNTNVSAGTLVLAGSLYGSAANSATVIVASGATLNISSGSNNVLGDGTNATWAISGTLNETSSTAVLTTPGNIQLSGGTLTSSATNTSTYGAYLGGAAGVGYATTITANGTGNLISAVSFGIAGVETLATPQATDVLTVSSQFFTRGSAGAITKTGLGTVTLTGSNTYTGVTTISAGLLQIGNGGSGGSLGTGSVTDNGSLAFDLNNTVSLSNAISGTGNLLQMAGTVTLTGTISYTGNTNVSSGATLNANSNSNNGIGYGVNSIWSIAGTLAELNPNTTLSLPGQIQLSGGTLSSSATNTSGYGAYYGGSSSNGYATPIIANGTGNAITAVSIGIAGQETLTTPLVGDTLTASAVFFNRSYPGSIVKNGLGTLTLSGSSTYTAGTFVNSGTLILASATAFPANTNLSIGSVSSPATVMLNNSGGSAAALQVGNLSLSGATSAWTGSLDLTNNAVIVHNGTIGTIFNQVAQGYSAGTWQGSGGITSSTAASNSSHLTAVGVIINDTGANTGTSSGTAIYTSMDSANTSDGDIIVKYTYYGDANLDGQVDGSDYSRIDNGALNQLTGWFNGDFNYDGVIDGSDYTLIDNAYNTQGANLEAKLAAPTAQIAGATSAVPEPASLGLIGIGVVGLLGRRRRHA